MFANSIRTPKGSSPHYEGSFVQEVRTGPPPARNPRTERFFLVFWIVIALKSVAVVWAVRHYRIPFHPLWVIAPTLAFAVLITIVYWRRS